MLVIDLIFQSDPYSLKELTKQVERNFDRVSKKFILCPDELLWFRDRGLLNNLGGENGCRVDGLCDLCIYDWLFSEAIFESV